MEILKDLPPRMQAVLNKVPPAISSCVQEIRLRVGCPITLSTPEKDVHLSGFLCTGQDLYNAFEQLCEYSVHSHQEELKNGFFRTRSGCRVGVAGTAVIENGQVVSVRSITSLCIRVKRSHEYCAAPLLSKLTEGGSAGGLLICGEPASGKTAVLNDTAVALSTGRGISRRFRVAVVDERGEFLLPQGVPCDVLLGYPKAQGIEQAVRTLAPEWVLFDELGDPREVAAVLQGLQCGVAVVATLHARDEDDVRRRAVGKMVLGSGAFRHVAFMCGREKPGCVRRIVSVEGLL